MKIKHNAMHFKFLIILVAFFLAFAFMSCGFQDDKIQDVLTKPRDFLEKPATISGEVTDSASLFFMKYFVIKDDTGEIMVITEKPIPKAGSRLKVTGLAKDAFSFGNKQIIVLIEK